MLSAALVAGMARRIVAGLLVSGVGAFLAGGSRASRLALLGLGVACTFWGAARDRDLERTDALAEAVMAGTTRWEATVVDFPRSSRYGASFLARGEAGGQAVTVRVYVKRFDVHYGDRLQLEGAWRPAGDRGPGSFRARHIRRLGTGGNSARRILWRLHHHARLRLTRATGERCGLPLALVLGERGHLPQGRRDDFVRLGISHLFALSGMHLGLLALLLARAARLLPRGRLAVLAAALALYVGMVGDLDSLNRALVMALALITARALGRPVQPMHALGVALYVLLLFDPDSLRSAGFQLSFAATFAVLVLAPRIGPPARVWKQARWPVRFLLGARATVLVGIGVTIFVAPIQLSHFGEVSLVGPLATWVFATAVAVMLVASLAGIALAGLPYAGDALWTLSGWLDAALRRAAHLAPDPVQLRAPDAVVFYTGLALCWWGGRRARALGGALVLCSFIIRG